MRLLVLSLFGLAGVLYSLAAFEVYHEELQARATPSPGDIDGLEGGAAESPPLHPEANLARLRLAFASEEYTDDLVPYLERALEQAPTFYQPPFLLAAFHANRLEQPETIERSFVAALNRFPSNGRLHLTFAEWLLTPRATAPYRTYRADTGSGGPGSPESRETRERAIGHVARATSLEPNLARRALDLMLRFRVPMGTWTETLPDDETTRRQILHALDRAPEDREARAPLLSSFLSDADTGATLRTVAELARKWDEPEIALAASERWHELALEAGSGPELTRASLSLARDLLDGAHADRAYRVMRETLATMEQRGLTEDSAELLVGMGDLYLTRRQLAMAQSLFTEAATRFPFHTPAFLGLARAHHRAGDHDAAILELRRVLTLDPENSRARALLAGMLDEMPERR